MNDFFLVIPFSDFLYFIQLIYLLLILFIFQIISNGAGKVFAQGHGTPSEYKQVNDEESRQLADAFLAYKFLDAQYNFLKSKGKGQLANVFWILKTFRPLWSWMIPKK